MKKIYVLLTLLIPLAACNNNQAFPQFHEQLKAAIADRNDEKLAKMTSPDLQTSFGPEQKTMSEWLKTENGAWEILDTVGASDCAQETINSELPDVWVCPANYEASDYRMTVSQIDGKWLITALVSGD